MQNEDFDKPKLKPILEEAYKLVLLIEEKTGNKDVIKKKLESQRQDLIKKKKDMISWDRVEDQQENCKMLFKSIMCPLGERCNKDNRSRWPKSGTKTVTPFGRMCLYAHHYHELEFPETLNTKIAAINKMKKGLASTAETEAKNVKGPFIPPNNLKNCSGCLFCTFCISKRKNKLKTPEEQKVLNEKNLKMMKKFENKHTTEFVEEMRDLKKKLNIDDNYCKKFGMLKKAAVLLHYERENDAIDEIAKAVKIV